MYCFRYHGDILYLTVLKLLNYIKKFESHESYIKCTRTYRIEIDNGHRNSRTLRNISSTYNTTTYYYNILLYLKKIW